MIRTGWMLLVVVAWLGMGSASWAAGGKEGAKSAPPEDRKGPSFTQEEKHFSNLTMGFYLNPSPEKLMPAFLAIRDLKAFFHRTQKSPDDGRAVIASQVTAVFLATLVRKQPELAQSFTRQVKAKGSDEHKMVLADAIARSGIKKRDEAVNQLLGSISPGFMAGKGKEDAQAGKAREIFFARIRQQPPLDLRKFQIIHPGQIDLLWAAFFASGDKEYVSQVAHHLTGWLPREEMMAKIRELNGQKRTPQLLAEVRQYLVSGAAGMSLGTNAAHIPDVRVALEKFAASDKGAAGKAAKRILQSLEGSR
ncbi:MAG: hypothetical protein HQM02_08340 [Magnetococcales bacterium]|nr:hypothetical protein [Magnetococcales bacterium]